MEFEYGQQYNKILETARVPRNHVNNAFNKMMYI